MKHTKILFALVLLLATLMLCSCHTPSPDPADTTPPAQTTPAETTPAPASDVQNAVRDYFDWQPPQDYFVVENYEDLQKVYTSVTGGIGIYTVQGNWYKAQQNNTYDQEYFKTGFVVVAMFKTDSMENSFSYGVNDVNDKRIYITVSSTRPMPYPAYPGAYLMVIPIEGQYKGQQIQIVHNRTLETMPAEPMPSAELPTPSESLASPDDVQRVGIKMGDVIVEGLERVYAVGATDENNNNIPIDMFYEPDCEELLKAAAVVRYSPDYEEIINLENVYTAPDGKPFVFSRLWGYSPSQNGKYSIITDPPTSRGVYLLEITVDVWSPIMAEREPERAPKLPPKQPSTTYPEGYAYYFTVIVE